MKVPTVIATFEFGPAARLVAVRLRDAGFETTVRRVETGADEGIQSVFFVLVPAFQAARALSWTREFDAAEGLLERALHCPQCGSIRVGVPQPVHCERSEGLPHPQGQYQCLACGTIWQGQAESVSAGSATLLTAL